MNDWIFALNVSIKPRDLQRTDRMLIINAYITQRGITSLFKIYLIIPFLLNQMILIFLFSHNNPPLHRMILNYQIFIIPLIRQVVS